LNFFVPAPQRRFGEGEHLLPDPDRERRRVEPTTLASAIMIVVVI
jgi:hypothetical protein